MPSDKQFWSPPCYQLDSGDVIFVNQLVKYVLPDNSEPVTIVASVFISSGLPDLNTILIVGLGGLQMAS
jgi:hypothetical protein